MSVPELTGGAVRLVKRLRGEGADGDEGKWGAFMGTLRMMPVGTFAVRELEPWSISSCVLLAQPDRARLAAWGKCEGPVAGAQAPPAHRRQPDVWRRSTNEPVCVCRVEPLKDRQV